MRASLENICIVFFVSSKFQNKDLMIVFILATRAGQDEVSPFEQRVKLACSATRYIYSVLVLNLLYTLCMQTGKH